ncbi:MAG: GNAT family N-acetyltransferase [Acidimicrobiales bacterium]
MVLATMGVPVIDLIWGTQEDRKVIVVVSAGLVLLILTRVHGLMQALQRGQDRLRHDAVHDALTGLANRVLFAERTEAALAAGNDNGVAVLFVDLDDFKNVNDSLGHEAGDLLLAEVANRLIRCVGPADTVARFGGDEFAVLLPEASSQYDAATAARRILDALEPPIDLTVRSVNVAASIGIAIDHEQTLDVDTMLRNADVAMYLSKSRGKGRYEIFEAKMHEEAVERLDLKADLQRALENDQFVVHYQPIFDLDTGHVALAEALIRWKHPSKGLIGPDRFVPLAEENGMIVDIGEWVLREACVQAAHWQKIPGCQDMGITVNLSMRQLQDNEFINALTRALKDSGLSAEHLVLEITESMLALDAERSVGILEQLKTIGVKLAIDDFGTGYSSLSYLRSFPVDSIKIDRSFINELHRSTTSTALIEAMVNLANALGAYTVAEGIEHGDQAGLLRRLGCDRGQGFYYCRPLAGPALTTLLRDHLEDEKEPLLAWRRSSERVQSRAYDIDIRTGLSEINAISREIKALNDDLNVPVMGQWPWLGHWSESFDSWTPMMVGVRSAESGQLTAAAFLAQIHRGDSTAIVAMGNGSSLYTAMQARNDDAAVALAQGIRSALDEIPGAWSLDIEQVKDQDPTLLHLAEMLDHAQLLPELRVPRVAFSTSHNVDDVLSKSMRKQLRRSQNKIASDGLEMTIAFDRGRAITSALIDEVEAVHVSRDRAARRNSDLDRPAEREFWRRVTEGGRNDWEVEIASLRLDGALAAYVVALLDGDTYRVYDGRMNTDFQDYSPGRLVEAAALSRAMADPRFAVLDWMSGIAAEKLLTTNIAEGRARLVATSGSRYVSFPKKSDFRRENSRQ